MRNLTPRFFCIIILGFFMLTLVPLVPDQSTKTCNLQTLILQIQELQKASENSNIDFTVVFSNTLSTLKTAAGFQTIISKTSDDNRTATVEIIVQTRIPYLLAAYNLIQKVEQFYKISSIGYPISYQSHIISPETPPPIFS